MKQKLYYLTRSYNPYQKSGGSLIRNGAVQYLEKLGWNVTVVLANYGSDEFKIVNYEDALKKADIIVSLVAHKEFVGLKINNKLDFCGVLS